MERIEVGAFPVEVVGEKKNGGSCRGKAQSWSCAREAAAVSLSSVIPRCSWCGELHFTPLRLSQSAVRTPPT